MTSAAATKPIELYNVAECFLDVRSVQSAEYRRKGNLHLALLWYDSPHDSCDHGHDNSDRWGRLVMQSAKKMTDKVDPLFLVGTNQHKS